MKLSLPRQVWFVTRLTMYSVFLQTLLNGILFAETGNAQKPKLKEVYLSIHLENVSIMDAFAEIGEKTDFNFLYDEGIIDDRGNISIKASNASLFELLKTISKDKGLKFERINENIYVSISDQPKIRSKEEFLTEVVYDREITGTVTDENGEELPGVNVLVKGTTIGTITDANGQYILNAPDDATTLVFSYVGYNSEEVEISGRSVVDLVLTPDITSLTEIVVIGYGTQQKKDVTGSIASVEASQIASRPVTSVEEAMQGLIPGLNIAQRASSPGELGTVSIRGLGSITAGTQPLWVVDGFPTDQRNAQAINPADILSVDVLKDASSTAIYGSRGANGVIIITTKSGKEGRSNLNLTVTGGVATVPESARFEVLNAEEYVQFHTEKNGGTVPDFIADNWDGQTDTDWQDLVFQNGAFQNYALSASGGGRNVNYLLSANYIDQQGVIKGEGQKKYSARAKIDFRPSDRVTIGLNVAPNLTTIERNSPGTDDVDWSSLYAQALLLAPILPVNRPDGTYSMNSDLPGSIPVGNPLETMQNYDFNQTLFRMLAGVSVSVEVTEGLSLKSFISTNIASDKSETYYLPTVGQIVPFQLSPVSTLSTGQRQEIGWLNENIINYKREWGDHSFDVVGGFTLQKNDIENVGASVEELQVPGVRNVNIGNTDNLTGSNSITGDALVSYLGRINYGFKGKYLLTATLRTDGSSRFGTNDRYETFGSFALGWRFSEEAFFEGLNFLNNGKLRVSYGTTGSNSIPDFAARANLASVRHSFGDNAIFGTRLGNPGNPSLTWETSEQLNIGLDADFAGNRLNLVLDYFNNETTSLLLTKGIVPSSGYSSFLTNIGSMRNKGVELSLNATVIQTSDWVLSIGGNVTYNDQEILDLGGDDEIQNFFGALRRIVGGELQQIRGPKVLKVARQGDDQTGQPLSTPGALIYEDVDGDGVIGNFLSEDGQLIGDTNVDWIYGITANLKYKNFELSALLNGQAGAYVYDFFLLQVGSSFRQTNLSKEFWYDGRYVSESNPGDGKTPAANGFDTAVGSVSSFGVQKTDYLRIRNVTLTYNLPTPVLNKLGLSNGRIFTSIENLYTFTDFIGGNPEARRTSAGGPALIGGSQIAAVTDGRELGLNSPPGLPLPRIWTLGLSVNF